eukprot:3170163-Pleurochrysis_carterae.AAC.1
MSTPDTRLISRGCWLVSDSGRPRLQGPALPARAAHGVALAPATGTKQLVPARNEPFNNGWLV